MKELDFQKALIDAVKKEGGFGLKMSNRHLAGVPDLMLKLMPFDALLVECKRVERKNPLTSKDKVTPGTTKLQEIILKRYLRAGGAGGIFVLYDIKGRQQVVVTTQIGERLDLSDFSGKIFERKIGEPWPIREMIAEIHLRNLWRENGGGD